MANLMLSVMGAFAEFERALIRERTKAGLASARTKGRVGGNPGLRARDPAALRQEAFGLSQTSIDQAHDCFVNRLALTACQPQHVEHVVEPRRPVDDELGGGQSA